MPDVRAVAAKVLSAAGAAVNPVEPNALEVVAPPRVQATLGVQEYQCLGFGADLPEGCTRVSIESGFLDSLASLLADRGRTLSLTARDRRVQWPVSPQQFLDRGVVLENATYRFRTVDTLARARYLILVLRCTAMSDERREDVITVCVNETNGADADHLVVPAMEQALRLPATPDREENIEGLPNPWPAREIQRWCDRRLSGRIRDHVAPFLAGMQRRMGADLERLWGYYSQLRLEAAVRMEHETSRGGSLDRERLRIEAIEREYATKTEELKTRYSMRVSLELVQAMRIITPVCRVEFDILRRKAKRTYHLDWNPLSRRMDTLPCEGCGAISPMHLVCDGRLHILCRVCLSPCSKCGKEYCRVCHPQGCPRC